VAKKNDDVSKYRSIVESIPLTVEEAPTGWFYSRWVAVAIGVILGFIALKIAGFSADDLLKLFARKAPPPVTSSLKPLNAPVSVGGTAVPLAPKGNDSSVSKVPLDLILVRTEPGLNPQEGLAYLGTSRESPQTYVAGALLANGARISAIYADSIVLERGGSSVRLYVDEARMAQSRNQAGALRALLTVGGTPPASAPQATSREELNDYVRTTPLYESGVMSGYQVYAGERSGVFAQLGLKGGDVITAINGAPLNDPANAWETIKQLTEGASLQATVKRGTTVESVTLDGGVIVREKEQATHPVAPPMPPGG